MVTHARQSRISSLMMAKVDSTWTPASRMRSLLMARTSSVVVPEASALTKTL